MSKGLIIFFVLLALAIGYVYWNASTAAQEYRAAQGSN